MSKSNVYSHEHFFNNRFKEITKEYLKNIIDVKWHGFWHQDIIDEKPFGKFIYYLERFYQKKILRINGGGARIYSKIFNKNMYYSYPRENFYIETRKYLRNLINASNYNSKEYAAFDQLIPPNNTNQWRIRLISTIFQKGGYCFNILSKITGKEFSTSSIRVRKFCARTHSNQTSLKKLASKLPFL
ncbi:hypothetical protein [Photorhabdus noenieputensis]|uniref:hypothetical protein n=1 Tax=Photorhabdus noenieputensis TaxID=1208607 RepID=UPI001FD4931F|nr:hypothetical protein [Photorhabdus noenieputensis]MCK3669466.1 hypothetical protein [Photorhabdus noenieputensis]